MIWTASGGDEMGFLICRIFHHITWHPSLNVVDLDGTRGTYGVCACGKEYFRIADPKVVVLIGTQGI